MIIALQTLIFFRESLLAVLDRWLPPLFSQLFLKFSRSGLMVEDDGSEDQVFSDFDDERGVVFVPPVHAQRYAAVCDCLMDERWFGKLGKVVNMGKHHDMAFIKYLTEVPGITEILGVDIQCSLHCSSDLLDLTFENYRRKREKPLLVTLLRGNAADPDYRLIGCDAVIAIEMIEYMLPHDLDRLVHNLFGFVKPWLAVFTTPNADFNVLFKSIEKNGLRPLDHYFEWTRAQLHDWCSNIVLRYPAYTVSCRGVGPGPPGTSHYGCCSQLVLFVSKDYQKQMELNVNSLALVTNLPQPNRINDFINDWECPSMGTVSPNMICGPNDVESYCELRYGYCSCHSTLSPTFSEKIVQFEDKAVQCNLESEFGKSFVMFNVEEMYEVVRPRRRIYSRVYEMEDVASRLNNTMFEVKKFSKTTQNLMTKNRTDTLNHTREVMDEISHLTRILNFNDFNRGEQVYTWCNINWGENAPYWNQYYKVVAVYSYPYEEKDEDNVILDLISGEINKLLDLEYEDGTSVPRHVGKLEIPVGLIMNAVKHITEDVDRVIGLMEYSGYEVNGDFVVHSRILEDDSMTSRDDDWLDETYSDVTPSHFVLLTLTVNCRVEREIAIALDCFSNGFPFELNVDLIVGKVDVECLFKYLAYSTAFGHDEHEEAEEVYSSTCWQHIGNYPPCFSADGESGGKGFKGPVAGRTVQLTTRFVARSLRRALDRKVKKLRTMFTHDEDITKELNHVVCRLLKIALSSNRGRQGPVQSKWLQWKLLDLLTLTEKAIVRRKIKFIEDYPLKALGYESQDEVASEVTELCKIKEDDTAMRIVEKYRHLLQASDNNVTSVKYDDSIELEDDLSMETMKILDLIEENKDINFENIDVCELRESMLQENVNSNILEQEQLLLVEYGEDQKIHRIQNWVDDDQILPQYAEGINESMISSGDDRSSSKGRSKRMKSRKKPTSKAFNRKALGNKASALFSMTNIIPPRKKTESKSTRDLNYKVRTTKTNTSKKDMKAKTSYTNLIKKLNHKAILAETKETHGGNYKCNFITKPNEDLYPSPIVQLTLPRPVQSFTLDGGPKVDQPVAATEDSILIQIVTAEEQETVAMRRSVGTDADVDSEMYEQELELTNVTSTMHEDTSKICYENPPVTTENVHSQTIFLYDINEPSTSKGVRHVSMDVQCGTDAMVSNYAMLSATTSLTALPKMFTNGIKIGDSFPDVRADKTSDFGTSTNDTNKYCMSPRIRSVGIKIKDSETRLRNSFTDIRLDEKSSHCTNAEYERRLVVSPAQSGEIKINHLDFQDNKVRDCFATAQKKSLEEPNTDMTVTETLKHVSSHLKIDSCSEFNSSFGSLPKTPLTVRFAQDGNNLRSTMPRFPMSKYVRPKLSCGGVHVHSYTDRQESEDVVYQGEWQQYKPVLRKKAYNAIALRKNKECVKKTSAAPISNFQVKPKKEKNTGNAKVAPKQVRYKQLSKMKEEMTNSPINKKSLSAVKVVKPILKSAKKITKVSSKLAIGNAPQKNITKTTVQIVRRAKSVSPVSKKDSKESLKHLRKCYIPPYLKKMAKKLEGQKPKSNPRVEALQNVIKVNQEKQKPMPVETKTNEIKTDLLKVYEPRENISYVVFRNEIDNSKSGTTLGETTVSVMPTDRGNVMQRALSPVSQNSSSCSSPNSVATVRAVPAWPKPKRHSTPNAKSNVSHNTSENKTPARNRKFKKILTPKIPDKDVNNKENVPESSNYSKLTTKDTDRVLSGGLIGTKDNIFTGKKLIDMMPATKLSGIKIPFVKSIDSKNSPGASCENNGLCSTQNSNMVVLIESGQPASVTRESSDTPSPQESFRIVDNNVLTEWIASPNRNIVESHTSNILAAMKQLVEESLDFIDSKTVVLSRDGSINTSLNELSMSQSTSFRKVLYKDSKTFHSLGDTLDQTTGIDSGAARSIPSLDDPDLLSFKSASISKFSDCFADSESYDFNSEPSNNCTVHDIYERKETILTQNPGVLAIQAFSGFSMMNAEPVAGDQPDYVNMIDSETGSGAYDTARLATSEELFVSGRSSESFASCLLEEDSVVPNWLFQITSRQQSGNISRSVPDSRLVVEPEHPLGFEIDMDENSNETTLAAGAGAGDGRGIHSDQSQDSSGRGSSLSSSATSSGAQSEAIIIDPTAFIAQFEMLREANASGAPAAADLSNSSARTAGFDAQSTRSPNGVDRYARSHAPPAASDVDADISSIDTDVPSDN